jgi:biopolymer transport protein ExbD
MILTGVALWVGSLTWLATRKLVPLDVPVSLSRGLIRSKEFSINLDSGYYIQIEVERTPSLGDLECRMWHLWGCDEVPSALNARWTISRAGRKELSGSSDDINGGSYRIGFVGRKVGHFASSGGRYKLDVEVLSDTLALNKGHPRLRIEDDGDGYNLIGQRRVELSILSAILAFVGGSLLLVSSARQRADHLIALGISTNPSKAHRTADSRPKLPSKALFAVPPPFGLFTTSLIVPPVVLLFVLQGLTMFPAHGIWVLTSTRKLKPPGVGQMVAPLVLRIDKKDQWFLDGKLVSPSQFPAALKEAFSRRPDWVVYLVADGDLEFQKPATAIDMIQGLHARVVLGAPREGNAR